MKWSNLVQNKCPQCNHDLIKAWDPATKMFNCKCGFRISLNKMQDLVGNIIAGKERAYGEVDFEE